MASLRAAVLALLVAPAHVFMVPARPAMAHMRASLARPRPLLALADGEADPYRALGISEDAGYDEINSAFDELSESYAGDAARLSSLEAAKDKVVNNLLQRRMAGAAASYEGMLAREDVKAPPKTPIWEIANDYRKRVIAIPSPKYALQVVGLMGGLAVCAWIAPSTAQTTVLVNTVSGMGFMYNRGEAEVPRDDFGQIGEIRPMKPKPFALTCAITAFVWLLASIRTNRMLAMIPGTPPKGLALLLRTTFVSAGLIIPALFIRVTGFFNDV